ncbi:MAG: guanylate kinase [Candidatus Krumholzibacteriia bacterium]|jgi:guanylate kinase
MIVLITGPSGAGKSSVIHRLVASNPRLAFSVSTTTRPRREGEVDGVDYDFVDESVFAELLAEDSFIESAVVHGNSYGTRRSRLDQMVTAGEIPILDIDVQGGLNVINIFGSRLVSIFLFPPSWADLETRLRSRGTDSEDVIATRLANASHEISSANKYRYWVVNDDLDAAVNRIQAVITAEECRRESFLQPPLT